MSSLLTFFVPREQRDSAGKKPVFVGKFTMSGWSGHSGFYLFKCLNCRKICVDYPHGYRDGGCLYIRCDQCRHEIILSPGKYKDIYERERVVSPPTVWQGLHNFWRARKKIKELEKITTEIEEKHGVKVMINGKGTQVIDKSRMNLWNAGLVLLALYTFGIFLFSFLGILN